MKTEIHVTVDHSHPMPDLADLVSARAWSLAGVNSVEGRLAAQAAPSEQADLRQLMGMNEAEIDTELLAAGISPDDAVKRADRAIKGALATVRAERRAIEYGDIVHKQVVAMRAAVVAAKLESPEVGIQWIANTLFGPGHYPDIEAARELGGAQALFDKEMAEHEAFRAAHPAPVAAQPSQAPVVQAGEYPPLPEGKAVIRCVADTDEGGWVVDFDCEGPLSHEAEEGDELFTADQMHAYLDADRASTVAALKARVAVLEKDAERYRQLRRGQKWSVVDGIGTVFRADELDAAIDAALTKGQPAPQPQQEQSNG